MICNTLVIIIGSTVGTRSSELFQERPFDVNISTEFTKGSPSLHGSHPFHPRSNVATSPSRHHGGFAAHGQISLGCPTPAVWLISMDQASEGYLSHHSKDLVFDVFNPFRLLCGSAVKIHTGTSCPRFAVRLARGTLLSKNWESGPHTHNVAHFFAQVSIGLRANKSWIVVMHGCHPISLSKANLRVFCFI